MNETRKSPDYAAYTDSTYASANAYKIDRKSSPMIFACGIRYEYSMSSTPDPNFRRRVRLCIYDAILRLIGLYFLEGIVKREMSSPRSLEFLP